VTHLSIFRGAGGTQPDALVAGRGIFATHYVNASLGLTALVRAAPGGPNYFVYLNRSDLDLLTGPFAGIMKRIIQRRVRSEAASVLRGLRQRLESGVPAQAVD
jgi:hypothetical protein